MFKFLFFLLFPALAFTNEFKIIALKGDIKIDNQILSKSSQLKYGQILKSHSKSFIKFKTPNNHLVVLGPNSTLILEKTKASPKTILHLVKGQLRSKAFGPKESKPKFYIKTKTASVGIRGTEFHIIHNPLNKITSTLSYQGEVEMRKIDLGEDEFEDIDSFLDSSSTISIPKGSFAGSYSGFERLSDPVKINPEQFIALSKNESLKMESMTSFSEGETVEKEIEIVPPPKDEFEEDNDFYIGEKVEVRPGGYLDLNTGIYVSPPKDASFNEEKEVYEIPKDYGEINEKSGEYIPPLGLILHPIKGFKVVSKELAKGVRTVRTKSLEALESFAENLNKGFGIKPLQKIHNFIKGNRFLSKLKFIGKTQFTYDSNVIQRFYKEIIKVTNQPSWVWNLDADLSYKKFFSKNWYINPHFIFNDKIHLRAHTTEVKELDNYDLALNLETGRIGDILGNPAQFTFIIGKRINRKRVLPSQSYENYLDSDFLNPSLYLKWNKHWSTQFEINFENYSRREGYEGYLMNPSAYLQYRLSSRDYIRGIWDLNYRKQKDLNDEQKFTQLQLQYFRKEFFSSTDLFLNFGPTLSDPGKEFNKGENELLLEYLIKLRTSFYSNISYELFYKFENNYTKNSPQFNYTRHLMAFSLAIKY